MSDTTETPTSTAPAVTTPTPDTVAPGAPELAKLTAQLATLTAERDSFAERAGLADALASARDKALADLAALQADRDKALADVDRMTKAQRESTLLDKLYASLPHAPRADVKRMLAGLAAEGKADKHTDDPVKTAAAILGILQTENSALLRAPVGANGGTNPTTQVSPHVDPILALMGPRRRR